MGEQILEYYKYVEQLKGAKGKIKLAQKTKIPITKAAMLPDSPKYIEAFKKAVEELTGKPIPDLSKLEKNE